MLRADQRVLRERPLLVCERPGCERPACDWDDAGRLCLSCALEAELFEREARVL